MKSFLAIAVALVVSFAAAPAFACEAHAKKADTKQTKDYLKKDGQKDAVVKTETSVEPTGTATATAQPATSKK